MADAFDNLKNLHLTPELMTLHPPKPETRPGRRARATRTAGAFYHLPEAWFDRAYMATTSREQLIIAVRLFRHWRLRAPGKDTIIASNIALKGPGFSRQAKGRALQNLRAAGLLEIVEQRDRASPRIRIIE
jgi:hypothetical protein